MKTVQISASAPYSVHIGAGLLNEINHFVTAKKIAIISDSIVWPLYGEIVSEKFYGLPLCRFVFSAGESSKNGNTYLDILNFLAENQLTRSDLIIALGGGVVGDLAGFAAATYLRGISLIQIPTTLLAAVDSSVGGKTAIDLPAGKNLAGAFYQPNLVLCDTDTLRTLPENIFLDGCAEIIKYGILYDPELFAHLEKCGPNFDREFVISRCVALKGQAVSQDEFDTGVRQKLNLGHTIGHGIERCSNYSVSHGRAVGTGIAVITRSACAAGICSCSTRERILALLQKFNLEIGTEFSAQQLAGAALYDKKRTGNTVNLVVPESIGSCRIDTTPIDQLEKIIQSGL